jgi:hypothetical protein
VSTYAEIVDEILGNLQGHTAIGDRVATLTAGVDVDDTTLVVDDATGFSRGVVEVGNELMYVSSFDPTTNTMTIAPSGRGYRSTGAQIHSAGDFVTMSPAWPRATIAREINNTIRSLYPMLFATGVLALTTNGVAYQYDIDDSAERVVDVRWFFDSVDGWHRITGWEVDRNTDVLAGTVRLNIYDNLPSSAQLQVVYAVKPTTLSADTDDFSTTGLNDSVKDLVVLGVVAKMAQFIDVGRLSVMSAETDQAASKQVGTAMQLANQLRQQYQQRLAEEMKILDIRFPARSHRVR